jgi:hypothetical protein
MMGSTSLVTPSGRTSVVEASVVIALDNRLWVTFALFTSILVVTTSTGVEFALGCGEHSD